MSGVKLTRAQVWAPRGGRPRDPNKATVPVVRELVDLCDNSGMSQAEIAEKAGVSQAFVYKMRKRTQKPSITHIEWLGGVFGLELCWRKIEKKP